MLTIYGLKNCDTCRKARKWMGWETLLNRRGTTWRGLDDNAKNISDAEAATALMAEHPALMKRPIFDFGSSVIVGFAAAQQAELEQSL